MLFGKMVLGMGATIDFVAGVQRVIVPTEHTANGA